MRRIWLTALLAVPLLCINTTSSRADNHGSFPDGRGFGCPGCCFRLFPHMFQEGPLFNYGPYYGYYPFKPYGPWDAYLRYDPFFYGDPYANWGSQQGNGGGNKKQDNPNWYGKNPHMHHIGFPAIPQLNLFHKNGCTSCGFWHASWLHGGWFRGHTWLQGSPTHLNLFHKSPCGPNGCPATAMEAPTTGDAIVRYSGFGNPAQSAVYYPSAPALDPAVDVIQTAGQSR